ncbi:hypothetical protein [Bosea minatitlanensis]|uniref:Uncharacterized protein n=1 Tax=Bosea minatitlanensis TaxID=128782 RepID=A0ABW0F0Y0_9HYPH
MQLSLDQVRKITRKPLNAKAVANAGSVLAALDLYGAKFGLDPPHRLAQFLPQIMHESGKLHFDREVWGPTPAQKRYEGRAKLGNTEPGGGQGRDAGRAGAKAGGGSAGTEGYRR